MKLLLFILIPLTTFSQNSLNGKYCSKTNYVGYCMDFIGEKVEYCYWSCTGDFCLNGTFQITNDSLLLKFNPQKDPELKDRLTPIITTRNEGGDKEDSIKITIILKELNIENYLPFANIYLLSSDNSIMLSELSDLDGKTIFKLKKTQQEVIVKTSYVGLSAINFPIIADKSQTIIIEMARSNYSSEYENISRLSYEIQSFDKRSITLITDDGDKFILSKVKK